MRAKPAGSDNLEAIGLVDPKTNCKNYATLLGESAPSIHSACNPLDDTCDVRSEADEVVGGINIRF